MQGDNSINRGFIPPSACNSSADGHSTAGRKAGFTLIEVVIAMALLIMSLALFLGTFISARRSAAIADKRLEAIHGARQVMETLLSGIYVFDFPPTNGDRSLSDGYHTSSVAGVSYTVVTVQTQGIIVQDIYLTNYWVNPGGKITSTVSLAGSVSSTLHQQ